MMKGQVIFLNRMYRPSDEELQELDNMQEYLTFCHVAYSQENRTLSDIDFRTRKENVHLRARKRIGIVSYERLRGSDVDEK